MRSLATWTVCAMAIFVVPFGYLGFLVGVTGYNDAIGGPIAFALLATAMTFHWGLRRWGPEQLP